MHPKENEEEFKKGVGVSIRDFCSHFCCCVIKIISISSDEKRALKNTLRIPAGMNGNIVASLEIVSGLLFARKVDEPCARIVCY